MQQMIIDYSGVKILDKNKTNSQTGQYSHAPLNIEKLTLIISLSYQITPNIIVILPAISDY